MGAVTLPLIFLTVACNLFPKSFNSLVKNAHFIVTVG